MARRKRRSHRIRAGIGLPVLGFLVLAFVLSRFQGPPPGPPPGASARAGTADGEWRWVRRVVDGDTLVLESKERVRLIGVDTPETKHPRKPVERFGREASAFTRRMVEGKWVWLEHDQANSYRRHQDKYGRTLAYVFLEDGTFLNAEIVKEGYGHAFTRFPFHYLEEFRQYELGAREAGRGLWGGR